VERDFIATAPNELWLTDITEHPTAKGKLYLCAVKDVYSGRILGYSMDARMKSSLAVAALESAVRHAARQGPWCTPIVRLSLPVFPGVLDSDSDGRDRMLVPGAPRGS
jgi:transposase InsO family protein